MAAILITLRFPNAAPRLRDQATALPALSADLLFFLSFEKDALAWAVFSRFDCCNNHCATGGESSGADSRREPCVMCQPVSLRAS
jgi:hypothetical protein